MGAPVSLQVKKTKLRAVLDELLKLGKYLMLAGAIWTQGNINDDAVSLSFSKQAKGHQLTLGSYLSNPRYADTWYTDGAVGSLQPNTPGVWITFPGASSALAAPLSSLGGGSMVRPIFRTSC